MRGPNAASRWKRATQPSAPTIIGARDLLPRASARRSRGFTIRTVTDELSILQLAPRNDLLSDRQPNEAYLLAEPGAHYALYFPDGGSVMLDLSDARGDLDLRWIDLDQARGWNDGPWPPAPTPAWPRPARVIGLPS